MATFHVPNNLRRAELSGPLVLVMAVGDSLVLAGSEGGSVTIASTDIERMRIGVIEARRIYYTTRIWFRNDSDPIELMPLHDQWSAYRDVLREYMGALVANHRSDTVELGSSRFSALLAPVLFGLLAAATLSAAIALRGESLWGRVLIPAIPVTLFVLFTHSTVTRQWPRPMESMHDLNKQLPR